ncbi:MAG TPA: cyclic nucleotide-binding domain-containing protein [Smithella sp.]|nr:cyclic nucleotide-binding domain-containing protein [Smithella sp.]
MSDQINFQKLRSLTIFRELDKKEIETIQKHMFEQSVKKDSMLFMEDMPGEFLYIIVSGRVDIIKETVDKEKIILASMGPDEIIGEMSLIDCQPRSATGVTSEDSVLMVIKKQNFDEMLQSDPRIAAKLLMGLLKTVSRRLRIMDKKIEGIKKIVKR